MPASTTVEAPRRDLDLARMRRERFAKLQAVMRAQSIDAMLLLGTGNVIYASGAGNVLADNSRRYHDRIIVLVVSGDEQPHLFTSYRDGVPHDLAPDHVHAALYPETESGVEAMARAVHECSGGGAARIAIDDYTAPMWFHLPRLLGAPELVDAGPILTDVRVIKTPDEQECMRRSWEINEAATYAAEQILRPGIRLTDLSAVFLRRLFELGATANFLDPVFQAMPERIADGPWSTNNDVPFNLITVDHIVSEGDVIWTDTVMGYEGYASDVGRTWVAGKVSPTLRELRTRWQDITDAVIERLAPGVTGDVLTRVAIDGNGGTKPWLDHFFLAHGLGLEGGEPQQVGADKGPAFDEKFVLQPGMAIVVEPVTWLDGHAGWRCEELVFITENGHERVSRYPNEGAVVRGLLALEEGPRIDFDALRVARRLRVLAMMERHDIDVLMCTRQGNARYVVGHRPLWRAVITPWAPMCTLVRATQGIHLLAATWDDGIPADVPHEHLNALTWNASNTVNAIRDIPGLADAKRIAVDGMQPGLAKLLGLLAPGAELVDGEALLAPVRAVKLPAEIECLRTAIAMAEGAVTSVAAAVLPGATELELKGAFQEAVCAYGINHPTYEGSFCATPKDGDATALDGLPAFRRIPTQRPVGAGELVTMMGSVHYAGYEGVAGRTRPCSGPAGAPSAAQQALARRFRAVHDAVVTACNPGARPSELVKVWAGSGEPMPPIPVAYGIGLGVEAPVADDRNVHLDAPLEAGMVLVVQGYVWEAGVGGYFGCDTVHVTDAGPQRLTKLSHAPFDAA